MPASLRRRLGWGLAGVAGVCLIGAVSLLALVVKERDNRFCVACHLHEEKFSRLTAASPTDLTGFHHRKNAEVGCIACHGGADAGMRVRIWKGAAIDTLRFLVASYEEPTRMRLPLRDAECRQCHRPIRKPAAAPPAVSGPGKPPSTSDDPGEAAVMAAEAEAMDQAGTAYHAVRDHDTANVRCVRCHTSHTTDSDAANRFISRPTVQPICRECHKQM